MLFKLVVDKFRKEICDSSCDRADDDAAEDIRGVVYHKIIAACAHHKNVERGGGEEPFVLFAEREAKRGHSRHRGGGVTRGEGIFALHVRADVLPPFYEIVDVGAGARDEVFNGYVGKQSSDADCEQNCYACFSCFLEKQKNCGEHEASQGTVSDNVEKFCNGGKYRVGYRGEIVIKAKNGAVKFSKG